MTVKRISHIVSPQGERSEKIARKEERILRGCDQAIANLEDQLAEADEKAEAIIDSLGASSGSGDTEGLQDKFNHYIKACNLKRTIKFGIEDMKALKTTLNKEIEVVITPEHVVIDNK